MLTREAVESLEGDIQFHVKNALAILYESGVILTQEELLKEAILEGARDESVISLSDRILEFRRMSVALMELNELGLEYSKEQTDAN